MCPPGVDQTGRTPQVWRLFVPGVRQSLRCKPPGYRLQNGHAFEKDWRHFSLKIDLDLDLWCKLAKPSKRSRSLLLQTRQEEGQQLACPASPQPMTTTTTTRKDVSQLESMPAELLEMVFRQANMTKGDLLAVALSSNVLCPHVLRQIDRESRMSAAPWAGREMACIGNYLTELPKPFEANDLFQSSVSPLGERPIRRNGMCRARRLHWAAVYEYGATSEDAEVGWRAGFDELAGRMVSGLEYDRLCRLRSTTLEILARRWSSPPGTTWLLRNLTTKQFVRCHPTQPGEAQCSGYIDQAEAGADPLRIDSVLPIWICWTTELNMGRGPPFMKSQAPWAGHCFDIVLQEDVDLTEETWEDFTDSLVTEATRIRAGSK